VHFFAFFARLPGGSTVMFCYYLLEGDTPAPSAIYARLCHAFLVSFVSPNFVKMCREVRSNGRGGLEIPFEFFGL